MSACDESCEDTCGGVGPKGCDDCGKGWTASEQDGCVGTQAHSLTCHRASREQSRLILVNESTVKQIHH